MNNFDKNKTNVAIIAEQQKRKRSVCNKKHPKNIFFWYETHKIPKSFRIFALHRAKKQIQGQ